MIRVNNQLTAEGYYHTFAKQLNRLMTLGWINVAFLVLVGVAVVGGNISMGPFGIFWYIGEWGIGLRLLGVRNKLRNWPSPLKWEGLVWLKWARKWLPGWRYCKIFTLTLCILALLESGEQLTFHPFPFAFLLWWILSFVLSYATLTIINQILLTLSRKYAIIAGLNRVFTNFLSDFGEEEEEESQSREVE